MDKLRLSVTVMSKKQDSRKLSIQALCDSIGMSKNTYGRLRRGECDNLHHYLRVIFRCIDLLPASRRQELHLTLVLKLREEIQAVEPSCHLCRPSRK